MGEGEEDMIQPREDLAGIDDLVAELALARRALLRQVAEGTLCGRRFTHPHRPTQYNALGYLLTDTCACLRAAGHDRGCREHYATRPVAR